MLINLILKSVKRNDNLFMNFMMIFNRPMLCEYINKATHIFK